MNFFNVIFPVDEVQVLFRIILLFLAINRNTCTWFNLIAIFLKIFVNVLVKNYVFRPIILNDASFLRRLFLLPNRILFDLIFMISSQSLNFAILTILSCQFFGINFFPFVGLQQFAKFLVNCALIMGRLINLQNKDSQRIKISQYRTGTTIC